MNEHKERLNAVRKRIETACIHSGRQPDEVTLLAVSKRHPVSSIAALQGMGLRNFGENLLAEALDKQQELSSDALVWHYIGSVQSKKTRAIASHFQWVQSIDREKILLRLNAQRPLQMGPLDICLQVNIDNEPQKSGASPEEILQLARLSQGLNNIKLRGLMVIPENCHATEHRHDSFRRTRLVFENLIQAGHQVDTLSMGMSSDLEIAIEEGSTMVRIGTDLLGTRQT